MTSRARSNKKTGVTTKVADNALASLHHVLLKAREPGIGKERDYDKAYAFWLSMWKDTFATVEPDLELHSDVFLRHREISAVFSDDRVVGLIMYDWRSLRVKAHRDLSHFRDYPRDVLDALHASGHHQVMLTGQMVVDPNWRKKRVGPCMSDVLVGIALKRFLDSRASVMIALTRNDRKTHELAYRFGAVPLRAGHEAHRIASDVVGFYRERVCESPLPGVSELVNRLWRGTRLATRFSNMPRALIAPPDNDVVQNLGEVVGGA